MKSKMLKRAIAIMLCMVIVMGGAEHMRAGSSEGTEETTTETAEEEIVLSDDGDENPVADAEEEKPKAQTEETPSEEGQSGPKTEEGQSESKAEEGQSGPKVEEGQSGAQNPDAGETKTGEGEENIPEEELKEKPIMELTYEDSQVSIRVTADEEGNIPQGASLSVTPIEKQEIHDDMDADAKAEAEELNAQYDATAEKLQEKAQGEEYDILGFLAYDITFVDENGDKLEPNGSVSVSMDYKEAAIPEEVKTAREAGAEVADVTLMHLEESSDGAVKDVVDMVADESQEANVQTTEATEVEAAQFVTESFSKFTLVWKGKNTQQNIYLVDQNGKEIADTLPLNKEVDANKEVNVSEIAQEIQLSGYSFEKAILTTKNKDGSYNISNGNKISKLRYVERTETDWFGGTYPVKETQVQYESTEQWTGVGYYESVCFVYRAEGLIDLDGTPISVEEYTRLATAANTAEAGTLPITWKRAKTVVTDVSNRLKWDPAAMIEKFGSDTDKNSWETDTWKVWDGSRSDKEEGKISEHNFTQYLPNNQITVKDGKMYDSASWTLSGNNGSNDFYLFRGTFNVNDLPLKEGEEYGNYDFTLKSVVDDENLYINDNMFVFVYPTDTKLTSTNWRQYLAFWSGTSNKGSVKNFNDEIAGQLATQSPDSQKTGYKKITDGWYTEPIVDGAGKIIQNAINSGHTTEFRIDVIANDYTDGGAMYRLKLEAKENPDKVKFSFRKVEKENEDKGIKNTIFYLASENGESNYWLTSNVDGYVSAIVPKGTYTLKETSPNKNYLATQNEWKVVIDGTGVHMSLKDQKKDDNAELKGNENGWYITNTKRTDIQPSLGAPVHKKTIEKNDKDDYTLSLDVKGAVGSTDPIDILLIVDESGSMKGTGENNVNNAIQTLVAELTGEEVEARENIKIAVVGFSDNATVNKTWSDAIGFNYTAKGYYNQGTNWQAGIRKAEALLNSRDNTRKNASTYVVFLTDGKPTFRIGGGNGSDDYYGRNYNAAESEWLKSPNMMSAVKYVVDATQGGNTTECTNLAKAVGATKLQGSNTTTMQASFKQIAADITKPRYSNVVITDTLSVYADFQENLDVQLYANGQKLDASQYSYTINGKTIRVSLLNGGELTENVTYTVTFKIKPTQEAYQEFERNGYNATGDKDTDTNLTNKTSSDAKGFRSNSTASVDYEVNGVSDSTDYKHPVLQVDAESASHTVEKKWKGGHENSVKVKLVATYNGTEKVPEDYSKSLKEAMNELILSADNNWTHTWNTLPKYYYYTADGKIAKAEIHYSVEEVNPSGKYDVKYDYTKTGITTITNIAKTKWEIVKVSSNSSEVKLEGAEFTLTGKTTAAPDTTVTYTGVSGKDGVVVWKSGNDVVDTIPQGTYTLKETKAPGNYALSDATWTITVNQDGSLTISGTDVTLAQRTDETTGVVTYSYNFENTPMYKLPSTGGIGTYWYTIGGMLLMMAAALILYKKKKDIK